MRTHVLRTAVRCFAVLRQIRSIRRSVTRPVLAARLIFGASRQVHVTPLLLSLHWLRVPERMAFRLAVLVYRCLHGTAPLPVGRSAPRLRRRPTAATSLCDDLRTCWPSHATQRSTIGDRAFSAAAPAVWNSLREDVRASTSLQLFRRRLKSELFRCSLGGLGPRHST